MHHHIKVVRFVFILTLLFTSFAASAKEDELLISVPFQNINLRPNQTISSTFAFGQYPIIFCYENNLQSVGVVTWPYKGRVYSSTLSLSLITNGQYQGQFSDPSGTLTVQNNQNYPLVVNCVYGF